MSEYEGALRRAFVEKRANYIVLTSRRERFQAEAMNYGINHFGLEVER